MRDQSCQAFLLFLHPTKALLLKQLRVRVIKTYQRTGLLYRRGALLNMGVYYMIGRPVNLLVERYNLVPVVFYTSLLLKARRTSLLCAWRFYISMKRL